MDTPKTFSIRSSYRISGDPQIIGEELANICQQHNGELTPVAVVDNARDITSPLHDCFTWDDTAAAKAHRENQARYLIRAVTVKYISRSNKPMECRAFVSTQTVDTRGEDADVNVPAIPDRIYVPVDDIKADERKRNMLLSELKSKVTSLLKTIAEFEMYYQSEGDDKSDDTVEHIGTIKTTLNSVADWCAK